MDTLNYNITDGEFGGSLRNSVVTYFTPGSLRNSVITYLTPGSLHGSGVVPYLTPGSLHGSGVVPYLTPGSRQQSVGPVVGVSAPVGSVDSVATVDLLNVGRVDSLS